MALKLDVVSAQDDCFARWINIPQRETQREDEDPGNSESLTDLVVTLGEILGEDHDENHIDGQGDRSPGERKTSPDLVDISQAYCVGNDTHHTL